MTSQSPNLVSLGDTLFEVHHVERACPSDVYFEGLSDVAVLQDRIVILRRHETTLISFNLEGRFLGSKRVQGCRTGHGLRVVSGNRLALTDLDAHSVFILDQDLETVLVLNADGVPRFKKPFNHPADCAQSRHGQFYVADGYGNSMVHIFDGVGNYIRSFGKDGTGPGEFSTPHSILIDQNDRVCVADRENNRIQRFDLDGHYLDEIKGVYKPMALVETSNGTLLCTDQTPRLSAFSPDGELVGRCRTFGTYGHGLAVACDGIIIVAEMLPNQISILRPLSVPTPSVIASGGPV